ncbi:PBSX family phage terminase large subunit [Desulfitobacterium metallireducens]|uniref:Terminase n=1 Tax=Desulfitobacterium metallireducens DSM 15288 TaxID=871968 RepID=W0EDP9_9FIRM|nr:PBSX family phage terminase large subunit [Desulfitobacterium metallireducens]AHF07171.1 terminase [Desulfitobacterium metallireducens DSM 15288]
MKYDVDFTELPSMLNDWIIDIWENRDRYIVCRGGGGSGKSFGIAQLLVYRAITEPGHNVLVVRKVGNSLRESCFSLIKATISSYGCNNLFKINKTDMTIECINGNRFIFRGLDDIEKIKSINDITDEWIEEATEVESEDYRQLNIRLRGSSKYPHQMFISFNPVSATHWLKGEFFDNRKSDATVIETTYKDNKFLDAEAIKVLEDFKDTDPYYYSVYCLNQWGVTGKTVFPAQLVTLRLEALKKQTFKRGYFTFEYIDEQIDDVTIQWVDDEDGYITIYSEPKQGYPYVIGGDTAGDGSDSFTGHVIDNTTGEQVATLKHQFDEDLYSRQMYCLGNYYNEALIGIETNYSTFPIKELERLNYYNQYVRELQDTYTGNLKKSFGFLTGKTTRPLMIANLIKIVRENIELINNIPTLEEMLTFVRNEKGRPEAQNGSHDDLVMGLCITYQIRSQQDDKPSIPKANKYDNSLSARVERHRNNLIKNSKKGRYKEL